MRSILLQAVSSCLAAQTQPAPRSPEYVALQHRLARGWNTWDVHSVAAQVLLPEGFTIRAGLKNNTGLNSDARRRALNRSSPDLTPGTPSSA